MDPLLTAVNSIHLVDEPPLASDTDCGFSNWFMCLWGYYYLMVFDGLSFGFPPVMYLGPLFMSFGRYFIGFYLVFPPVMYVGAVYLLFGWYYVGCFILFTCLLSFGYRHVDVLTLPVYHISSVSILSDCYPMVCPSLPVACEAHPVEIRVCRSRSRLSSGI